MQHLFWSQREVCQNLNGHPVHILLPPPLQFSQMMLVYMGLAADIAEVFEAFRESKVGVLCTG